MIRRTPVVFRAVTIAAVFLAVFAVLGFAQPAGEKPQSSSQGSATQNTAQAGTAQDAVGILVISVEPSSPAEKAGIVRGDIILAADGKDVNRANELGTVINAHKAGDALSLKLKHGDEEKTVSVTLVENNGRPYLGIAPFAGSARHLPMDRRIWNWPAAQAGVFVAEVVAGGPAEKAGLKTGDVIESLDGIKLDPQHDLSALVLAHKVGDTVTLSVRSQGQEPRDVKVTLDKNPQSDSPYLGVRYGWAVGPTGGGTPYLFMRPGPNGSMPYMFSRPNAPNNQGPNGIGVNMGVLVRTVSDNSPASKAGLKPRDLITAVDGVKVTAPRALYDEVAKHKPGDTIKLAVFRFDENTSTEISVTLGETPQGGTSGAQPGAYLGITMSRYIGVEGSDFEGPMPAAPGPLNMVPPATRGFGFGGLRTTEPAPAAPGI